MYASYSSLASVLLLCGMCAAVCRYMWSHAHLSVKSVAVCKYKKCVLLSVGLCGTTLTN